MQNDHVYVRGKAEQMAIPAMPMFMAIFCCILNFLIPGLGTVVAGFTVFCCARNEHMDWLTRWATCWTGFGIGLLQLTSVLLFFLGWVWSCIWGVFFITMSAEYYHGSQQLTSSVHPDPAAIVTHQPDRPGYFQSLGYHPWQAPPPYPGHDLPQASAPHAYPEVLSSTARTDRPQSTADPESDPPPPYPGPPLY